MLNKYSLELKTTWWRIGRGVWQKKRVWGKKLRGGARRRATFPVTYQPSAFQWLDGPEHPIVQSERMHNRGHVRGVKICFINNKKHDSSRFTSLPRSPSPLTLRQQETSNERSYPKPTYTYDRRNNLNFRSAVHTHTNTNNDVADSRIHPHHVTAATTTAKTAVCLALGELSYLSREKTKNIR